MVLYSVALISNIVVLTAESISGEPNEKETTFNKEPLPINDEFQTILIRDFFVFDKTVVYRRILLGDRHKYRQSTSDQPCALDQIKANGVPIYTGYRCKYKSRKKQKLLLEGEDELWASLKRWKHIKNWLLN